MKTHRVIATAAFAFCTVIQSASALPITYNTLHNDVTASAALKPKQWIFWAATLDYWRFYGDAGDTVTITGRRLDAALDPAFYLFRGEYAATLHVAGLIQNKQELAFADDELKANVEAPRNKVTPGGDPQLIFKLPETGAYTVGFGSYSAGTVVDADGVYQYDLTVSGSRELPPDYTPDPRFFSLIPYGVPEVIPNINPQVSGFSVPDSGSTLGYLFLSFFALLALPFRKTGLNRLLRLPMGSALGTIS